MSMREKWSNAMKLQKIIEKITITENGYDKAGSFDITHNTVV